MSQHVPTDPLASAVQLIGAGGLGAVLLKLVERMFARADKGDDVAAGLRAEMVRRLERLEGQLNELEAKERTSFQLAIRLEAENRQLRRRYHRLMNYVQELVATIDLHADRLKIPEDERPKFPVWLIDAVDGPTADEPLKPGRETDL